MGTNAGDKDLYYYGNVPGIGKSWYDPTGRQNIESFSMAIDAGKRVIMDSDFDDAFYVHDRSNDTVRRYPRNENGLYAYYPEDQDADKIAQAREHLNFLIETVEDNRKGYTQKQYDAAKRARALYHNVGGPSYKNFKHMIRMNAIKDCPVTVEDANLAEKIFGPDVATLKGKTTRPTPKQAKDDCIEIPPEILEKHREVTLCIDNMFVNDLPSLTAIDTTVRYRSCVTLDSRSKDELYRALDDIFRFYNKAGFTITDIHADPEFNPLLNKVCDELNIRLNPTAKGEHVPEAERNNRTIEERIRAAYHRLPFKAIPKLMLRTLMLVATSQLNWFPAKGGISPYFSPHTIMTQRHIDYNKHCTIPFGAYVQAYNQNDPTNTNAPRTLDAIYLRPMMNKQGGHELMHLQTGKLIKRHSVKVVPMTELVIKAVEQMAAEQKMTGLKITGRNNVPILPADWIAGVDYDEDYEFIEDEEYVDTPETDDDDELNAYDTIEQEEIDELLEEDDNPIVEDVPADEADEIEHTEELEPDEMESEPEQTRSGRTIKPIDRLTYKQTVVRKVKFADDEFIVTEQRHNLVTQVTPNPELDEEYDSWLAPVMAHFIVEVNRMTPMQAYNFGQQYILQKGLKVFGKKGSEAAGKEVKQLHDRTCFHPISIADLTPEEKRKAQEALMFLTEKRDKSIKGRMVYNGKPTREWMSREDSASPTVSLESLFLLGIIDAFEGRDVMSADIPNAFVQTNMPDVGPGEERVVMKITGVLVDLMVQMAPEVYGPYVVYENGQKVLYVQLLHALYGMLIASILWYKQFRKDLEGIGFKFNPYDPCVANRIVKGKQQTIRFHVDDLKSSHIDSRVNDLFLHWLNRMYGAHGEVKATRGNVHDYLGMTFDYSEPGKLKVDILKLWLMIFQSNLVLLILLLHQHHLIYLLKEMVQNYRRKKAKLFIHLSLKLYLYASVPGTIFTLL